MHTSAWAAGFAAGLWALFSVFVHFAHRKEYDENSVFHGWLSVAACTALGLAVVASMYIAGWDK